MDISYWFLVLLVGLTVLFLYNAYNIYAWTKLLKAAGIPYVVVPFSESYIKFRILRELPPYKAFVKYVLRPLGFGHLHDYAKANWRLTNRKWESDFGFEKFGSLYCIVSPQHIQVEIADRDFVSYITGKEGRDKVEKPKWQYRMLNIFGENIITCIDTHWPKYRRITAPAFNERSYALVWSTSITQALQMQYHWTSCKSSNSRNTESCEVVIPKPGQDVKQFALNILSFAAFGVDVPFSKVYEGCNAVNQQEKGQTESASTKKNSILDCTSITKGFSMTFEKAIEYTTDHLLLLVVFVNFWPFWNHTNKDGIQTLPMPKFVSFLSKNLKTYITGWLDVGRYLGTLINLERISVQEENKHKARRVGTNNLLSLMVQNAVSVDQDNHGKTDISSPGLTPEELVGNAFIFALAGHETTTGMIEFALVLLSLYPKAQGWFLTALDEELADLPENPEQWKYEEIYKKFVSCKCLMFEVLRVFSPVQLIPKWIDPEIFPNGSTIMIPKRDSSNAKTTEWKSVHLPGGTIINFNCYGMHYNPEYWGPDTNEFRPSRWDSSRDPERREWLAQFTFPEVGTETRESMHAEPGLYTPAKGQFIPFSYGHRACLGRKFALVEFVAAMAVLFKDWRVDLVDVSGGGKTRRELERDAWEKIEETTNNGITTRIGQHVPLKLVRRKKT